MTWLFLEHSKQRFHKNGALLLDADCYNLPLLFMLLGAARWGCFDWRRPYGDLFWPSANWCHGNWCIPGVDGWLVLEERIQTADSCLSEHGMGHWLSTLEAQEIAESMDTTAQPAITNATRIHEHPRCIEHLLSKAGEQQLLVRHGLPR